MSLFFRLPGGCWSRCHRAVVRHVVARVMERQLPCYAVSDVYRTCRLSGSDPGIRGDSETPAVFLVIASYTTKSRLQNIVLAVHTYTA